MEEVNRQEDAPLEEEQKTTEENLLQQPVEEKTSEVRVEEQQETGEVKEIPDVAETLSQEALPAIAEAASQQEEIKVEPKWYIIQTLTGQEDRVKERIEGNIESLNLKNKVFRVLVPEEETVEIKGNKRIERKKKMYPGYVFVEMVLDEDAWYKIRSTTGVAKFIGGKTYPRAVSDREMQRVLKQLGIKEKEITVEFEAGEPIRIISGSFRGYTGSVAEVNPAKSKLKAMINIFGRDTSVEVDFDRVEKVV